jgi:uncharacterized protein
VNYAALVLLGVGVGCFGTIIGAGGGFLLAPILVLLYPDDTPATLASISLAVVFCNALSGSFAYVRQRKADVCAGLRFSAAGIPGAVLGALAVARLPRAAFEMILGTVLVGAAIFLLVSKRNGREHPEAPAAGTRLGPRIRHNKAAGLVLAFVVGFVSSLLGIGGGIIHVPALVHALGFPVHVATATSHFVLATTAGAGTITHIFGGAFQSGGWRRTIALGLGAMAGAQIGASLARRTKPTLILRALAVALLLVGVRIVVHAFGVM